MSTNALLQRSHKLQDLSLLHSFGYMLRVLQHCVSKLVNFHVAANFSRHYQRIEKRQKGNSVDFRTEREFSVCASYGEHANEDKITKLFSQHIHL